MPKAANPKLDLSTPKSKPMPPIGVEASMQSHKAVVSSIDLKSS